MNKQALVKLAQVRLAINHVLRQRGLTKQALNDPYRPVAQSVPVWPENPLPPNEGNMFYGNGNYYLSEGDMQRNLQNPEAFPARQAPMTEMPKFKMQISPTSFTQPGARPVVPQKELDDAWNDLQALGVKEKPFWYKK